MQHIYFESQKSIDSLKEDLKTFSNIAEIRDILESRFKDFACNNLVDLPHPHMLHNNMQAAELIVSSMLAKEKIIIVGDYDCDGVCATCIMLDFFELLGYANIDFIIANRFVHGYGFSPLLLDDILARHANVGLVITVDNGVSSFEASRTCKDMGIKLIITDHHTLDSKESGEDRIPTCDFLINPKQKSCSFAYKDICGALVAWYLCCAIKICLKHTCESLDNDTAREYLRIIENLKMQHLLLLAGIATISDVMPLNAINHTICKYTLKHLSNSPRVAFQVACEYLSCVDSQNLGFRLIPLINAAGRIDNASIALRYLRSSNEAEAREYFDYLKSLNKERKFLQGQVMQSALLSISDFRQNDSMVCVVGEQWHEGVLGIVAGRMVEEFKKPCFVLTNLNGICKGSGRSYGNIDLISSLKKVGHIPNRYGGHVGAVGLEIEYARIQEFIDSFLPVELEWQPQSDLFGILHRDLISYDLLSHIKSFEPYGNGNIEPKFIVELSIIRARKIANGFWEFHFRVGRETIKGMCFVDRYANCEFIAQDLLLCSATLAYDGINGIKPCVMIIIDRIYGLTRG